MFTVWYSSSSDIHFKNTLIPRFLIKLYYKSTHCTLNHVDTMHIVYLVVQLFLWPC